MEAAVAAVSTILRCFCYLSYIFLLCQAVFVGAIQEDGGGGTNCQDDFRRDQYLRFYGRRLGVNGCLEHR